MHILTCTAASDDASSGLGLAKLFSDPGVIAKLASNPRTQKHLADPVFLQKLQLIQQNPRLADGMLSQGDPRMIDVLGVLMGIDIQGFSRDEGSDELPPSLKKADATPPPPSQPTPSASSSQQQTQSTPSSSKVEEAADVEMEEADDEDAKAKKEAEAEKAEGAKAYKAKNFADAAAHFSKAWEIWPKDITFLTNLGGKPTLARTSLVCRANADNYLSCLLRGR